MSDNTQTKQPVFRIYLSHAIRGLKGNDATQEEINMNIQIAKNVGTELQAHCIDCQKMDDFPPIDIYVPANHDEFVQIAWHNGYITETEILTCDCEIINKCDLVILYGESYSKGMQVEFDYATNNKIPVFKMPAILPTTIQALQFVIHLLLAGGG